MGHPKSPEGAATRQPGSFGAFRSFMLATCHPGVFGPLRVGHPRINPSAARSLEEGLEETLTVHRLGVGWLLRRTLASSNPIESCLSTVERVARNVKRWREGEQALRWTATGLLEAQKKFRRVKGYRELELLHRRMNSSLTQQAQVA